MMLFDAEKFCADMAKKGIKVTVANTDNLAERRENRLELNRYCPIIQKGYSDLARDIIGLYRLRNAR